MKKVIIIMSAIVMVAAYNSKGADRMEGGYAGTKDQGHDEVVYNFLKHFSYEQYYWAYDFQFTSNNNSRVDAMDFAIFAGHGNQWFISTTSGGVNLATAGNTSNKGYGDWNCEFIAFESCDVVPSPLEKADWWSNWVKDGAVFDGLHQACGFRTLSWQSTDQDITDYYGSAIHSGYGVWQSWFDAINNEGRGDELGACVMNPTCQFDTHASFVVDPAPGDQRLHIWYQY